MLKTLAVSGYRSLRDVIVPVAPLTVVTGPNGSGKSNLYRALRLLAAAASGTMVGTIAREGGLPSLLWAGPQNGGTEGTLRSVPIAVQLGFASDELGYLVDLGQPQVPGTSPFARDPEIKREQVFAGPIAKPSSLLIDRLRQVTRVREGSWILLDQKLAPFESILIDLADGDAGPELLGLRRMVSNWRFYDHFRTDADAPVRGMQIGTRQRTLSHGGENLAATWASIQDAGFAEPLDAEVSRAFPGARVRVHTIDGRFQLVMEQPGILRPLETAELSDGTLRYLLLCAALLPAHPAGLIVLNEPESSLHPSLLDALARLIVAASERSQVIVVTHAAPLAAALDKAGALTHRLQMATSGTIVEGQGLLDVPAWNWGTR